MRCVFSAIYAGVEGMVVEYKSFFVHFHFKFLHEGVTDQDTARSHVVDLIRQLLLILLPSTRAFSRC